MVTFSVDGSTHPLDVEPDALLLSDLRDDLALHGLEVRFRAVWRVHGGESSHHMALPGTISLRADTLLAVVNDVCRSLAHHGIRQGSNLPALTRAPASAWKTESDMTSREQYY